MNTESPSTPQTVNETSSVTLVDQSIFDNLPLDGTPDPLCLQWTGGTTPEENDSVKTSLIVSNTQNNAQFELLNVQTVKHLESEVQADAK
ncbi:hypothetical protein CVS40_11601 [Lucilia cuprina]|nr:hypothetical protein CVS40_11601 [Lucilia cuprina]